MQRFIKMNGCRPVPRSAGTQMQKALRYRGAFHVFNSIFCRLWFTNIYPTVRYISNRAIDHIEPLKMELCNKPQGIVP